MSVAAGSASAGMDDEQRRSLGSELSPKTRLDFLDSLRGLAALYVMLFHMALLPEPDLALPQWARMTVLNGGMGVTLFFVVSAFSLFYTMPARLREPHPWGSFFVHRFFRIAPLFYLWIALSLLRDQQLFDRTHSLAEIALSVAFAFNLSPQGQEGFVWASWTIGVEMLFYALFPLYYVFATDKRRALCLALLLLVMWYAAKALAIYFVQDPNTMEMFGKWSFLKHLSVFACGGVAFHAFFRADKSIAPDRSSGLLLIVGALYLYTALLNGWLPDIFGDAYYWQAVLFAMLLVGLGAAPIKLLVNAFTKYLGKVSYSLYLSHPTVIYLLMPVYAGIQRSVHNPSLSFAACTLLTLAAVLFVSEITYRLVEEPGINLGKRLNGFIRARARL